MAAQPVRIEVFSPYSNAFVDALTRQLGPCDVRVSLAVKICVERVADGHVCLDFRPWSNVLWELICVLDSESPLAGQFWPSTTIWQELFQVSPWVGDEASDRPLIWDGQRLYLRKYFQAERSIAQHVKSRLRGDEIGIDPDILHKWMSTLFQGVSHETLDLQRVAALCALQADFAMITGGPGTGKTYTVVNLLALLAIRAREMGRSLPSVMLLAPTGKAAARLSESIAAAKSRLDGVDRDILAAIPDCAQTIHRALGIGERAVPRWNRQTPLPSDVVLVDEASMVDLELMAHLMDAVRPDAKLILLGDARQLASVDAGAVLGELCLGQSEWTPCSTWRERITRQLDAHAPKSSDSNPNGSDKAPKLSDVTVHLQVSRRYRADSGLGQLARAIEAGDVHQTFELLGERGPDDVQWIEQTEYSKLEYKMVRGLHHPDVIALCQTQYAAYARAANTVDRLARLEDFRVLCAARQGEEGVENCNALLARHLELIRPGTDAQSHFPGRAIMIRENHYAMNLFNGDVGVVDWAEDSSGADRRRLRAFFSNSSSEPRVVSLARLPQHESALAMTVHKSQGSEFDGVLIVLPPKPSPILTRELLYTAVTRAKTRVWISASRESLVRSLQQRAERTSGLADFLRKEGV